MSKQTFRKNLFKHKIVEKMLLDCDFKILSFKVGSINGNTDHCYISFLHNGYNLICSIFWNENLTSDYISESLSERCSKFESFIGEDYSNYGAQIFLVEYVYERFITESELPPLVKHDTHRFFSNFIKKNDDFLLLFNRIHSLSFEELHEITFNSPSI